MSRLKTVLVENSGNQMAGETAREIVREKAGYRETIREVTRSYRERFFGKTLCN